MQPRLASSVLAGALVRRCEEVGGFAAVLAKGDPTAGALVIILAERGKKLRILERLLQPGGDYSWQDAIADATQDEQVDKFLSRRRRFDPDLWVIELDVPSEERFAAEMNSFG